MKLLALCLIPFAVLAVDSKIALDKPHIDVEDFASLQRGARLFMNECAGCHSLQYMRYDALAKGIEITDENGKVLDQVVKDNLIFTGVGITDPIKSAMRPQDAANWFGLAAPDLTLEARYRGVDWIYTYLRSFYVDQDRPWGVNNLVYPDVAMPHVLVNLQGEQILNETGLSLAKKGSMTPAEFDAAMSDIVNFLAYVAEPHQTLRRRIGIWVLVFLGIFLIFSYLLKREYWKDVH